MINDEKNQKEKADSNILLEIKNAFKNGFNSLPGVNLLGSIRIKYQDSKDKKYQDEIRKQQLDDKRKKLLREARALMNDLANVEDTETTIIRWKNQYEWAEKIRREYVRDMGIRYMMTQIMEVYEMPPVSCLYDPMRLHAAISNTYGETIKRQFAGLPAEPDLPKHAIFWEQYRYELKQCIKDMSLLDIQEGPIDECDAKLATYEETIKSIKARHSSIKDDYGRYCFMENKQEWLARISTFYIALKALLESERFAALDNEYARTGKTNVVNHEGESITMDDGTHDYITDCLKPFCTGKGGVRNFLKLWPKEALDQDNM